jgi:type I restriction enzyme S subunit
LNLASFASGAAIPHIYFKDYSKCQISVPPLSEQSRIDAELDLLTGIIDKQNAQVKELDNLAQAIFYDMFGDPIENPKGWDVKNLGDLCVKLTDGTHNSPINTLSGDYPYITAKNIRKNGIDLSDLTYVTKEIHQEIYSRCNPEYGDVLYIKDGITTGIAQVNVLDFEFSLLSSVALLKLDKAVANPYFITGFLNSDSVYKAARSNMGGAAITRLTLTKLKSFRVVVPPLALQQSFAEKIQSIEKQKETIRASIADTQKLLDYTMDKYFG